MANKKTTEQQERIAKVKAIVGQLRSATSWEIAMNFDADKFSRVASRAGMITSLQKLISKHSAIFGAFHQNGEQHYFLLERGRE